MRQLQIYVKDRDRGRITAIAAAHDALEPIALQTLETANDPRSVLLVDLPNERVGSFLDAVRREVEDARFTMVTGGTLPLRTPLSEIQQRVRDVSPVSTLELVVSSLQSIGSWKGMLLYSVFSGIVGAYGVIFNVAYLLVAAMLINPMGAPAMVAVIGLSIGDLHMFRRGGLRFGASLLVQAVAAAALGYLYGIDFSTETMEQIASLSALAALLALVAGAAGAQSQVQAERDSLVSGTAAGFMVAAALAPPAAVLGLAVPLARWDYAALMAFLLLVQFVAIALGGWLVLLAFGTRPGDPSLERGSRRARSALAASLAALLALVIAWQLAQEPAALKADLSREAVRIARDEVRATTGAGLVEASARFTRPDLGRHEREGLIVEVLAERLAEVASDQELEQQIRAAIQARIRASMRDVVPFVQVTVLPPAR